MTRAFVVACARGWRCWRSRWSEAPVEPKLERERRASVLGRILGLISLGGAVACDQGYTTHLRANVRRATRDLVQGATPSPAAGAWVVPMEHPEAAVRVGDGGLAATDHGGFLKYTVQSPVLVALPGHRAVVAMAGRDFEPRPRSWFFNTEWDAELSVTLVPLPAGTRLPLECGAGKCHMRTPCSDRDSCMRALVVLEPSRVRVLNPSTPRAELENGAWEVELPVDLERPAELVGVVTHFPAEEAASSGRIQAVVTDSVQLEP